MSRSEMWVDGVCVEVIETDDADMTPADPAAALTAAASTLRDAATSILSSASALSPTGATRKSFEATAAGLEALADQLDPPTT